MRQYSKNKQKFKKIKRQTGAATPTTGLIAKPTIKVSQWPGVVPGRFSISEQDRSRVHALRMQFKHAIGTSTTLFLRLLMRFLIDYCQKRVSWTVKDIDTATFWTPFLKDIFGDLGEFLCTAGLLDANESVGRIGDKLKKGAKSRSTLSRKQLLSQAVDAARKGENTATKKVRLLGHQQALVIDENAFIKLVPSLTKFTALPRRQLPLSETAQRKAATLAVSAVDTILSIMPSSKEIPMYVGDVGQQIGKWGQFNASHGGKLGGSLMEFLELHPEHFEVSGNIVRRVHSTKAGRVRIRFADGMGVDDDDDDDDVPNHKKSKLEKSVNKKSKNSQESVKRRWLSEAVKAIKNAPLSTRAKKKKVLSIRNRERFNKNRKYFDPSSKVKGFVKPKSKKLTGRGARKNLKTAGKR